MFYQRDLLADPNSNWSFEPKTGLKLKKAKIDDTGQFQCRGTYKTQQSWQNFVIYVGGTGRFLNRILKCHVIFNMESNLRNENLKIGMELNRTDGVGDPVEGSNVNLMCRTYVYTASFSPPKWAYQINGNGQMRIIDETNQFEGLKFPLESWFHHYLK